METDPVDAIWGLGKFLTLIHRHYNAIRAVMFTLGILLIRWNIKFLFIFSTVIELITCICQYLSPRVDRKRKAEFISWIDDFLTSSGAESAITLNKILTDIWPLIFHSKMGPFIGGIMTEVFSKLLPTPILPFNVHEVNLGTKPPQILQIIAEPAHGDNSASFTAAVVVTNDMSLRADLKLLGIPVSARLTDIVAYVPLHLTLESPLEGHLRLGPISAIAFSAEEPLRILNCKLKANGFVLTDLPLVGHLFALILEHFIGILINRESCVVWDWVTNKFAPRGVHTSTTERSKKYFSTIADLVSDIPWGRFSLPEETLNAFNIRRELLMEQAQQITCPPDKKLIWMGPPHGVETMISISQEPEKQSTVDICTQTELS